MLSVELRFKTVSGRDLTLETLVEMISQRTFERLVRAQDDEAARREGCHATTSSVPQQREQPSHGPRGVGIDDAAVMVGLSKHTIRKYVSEQKISAVRIGRRIIIPVQSLEKLLREGA